MQKEQRSAAPAAESYAAENRFDDSRIVAAVQEFQAALEAGRATCKRDFVARHPQIAVELQECLDALELLHGATPELRGEDGDEQGRLVASPKLLGDFRLLREIGRGGMGVVYEAVQISLNRRVAVKILPFAAALDRTHLQRFHNEAQAAAGLHHTNIVPVYAVGVERGVHFYAMQLIDGEPLNHLIAYLRQRAGKSAAHERAQPSGDHAEPGESLTQTMETGAIDATSDLRKATSTAADFGSSSSARLIARESTRSGQFRLVADFIRQAALALEYAHQFGIVHRDVKPANLLINDQGNIWITDFGLAHIQADVSLTRTGDVLGTLRYMSPEQAAGAHAVLDHRTDIYSLGVTFYELLTLEPVFSGSDRHALLRQIMDEEPRSPRSIDSGIPAELETIVLKAIGKVAQDRYSTARELADDLQRWLDDKPILARRPTLVEQMRKWRRRHRALVRMAGCFLLLLLLALLGGTALITMEHAKTKAAYQAEMNQRLASEESFRQARQAVDTFSRLGEEELTGNPAHHALRRKFLETALEYYRSFLRQRQNDPLVRAELAASSERVEQLIDDLAVLEGFAPLRLLSDDRVRRELALSPSQCVEIDEHLAIIARERNEARNGNLEASGELPPRQLADILRLHEQKIAALLNPPQTLRLKQIAWQEQGPAAFKTSEIVAALHLTAQQRGRISEIIEAERPDRHRRPGSAVERFEGPPPDHERRPTPDERQGGFARRGPPPDFGGRPAPPGKGGPGEHRLPPGASPRHDEQFMHEMMPRTLNRILATLTDEQRQTWRQLVGAPFSHDPHRPSNRWPPP